MKRWFTAILGKCSLTIFALLLFAGIFLPTIASADSFARGFLPQGSLKNGEIVALAQKANTVKAAPAAQPSLIYGVVVNPSSAPVTFGGGSGQVVVATNGAYPVLVNTFNGPIKTGDYISLSNTDGVGSKATGNDSTIVGQSLGNFNNSGTGQVKVNLDITRNPLFKNSLSIPAPLQRIGNSIAGREASPFKIYAALVVFMLATAVAVILLVVGVRSALVSIGRNPLSRPLILRGLFQVVTAGVLIFLGGLVAVYLLLRL